MALLQTVITFHRDFLATYTVLLTWPHKQLLVDVPDNLSNKAPPPPQQFFSITYLIH